MYSEFVNESVLKKQIEDMEVKIAEKEKLTETAEASEVTIKEVKEAAKVLEPDMETIKTQSLEAVKQSNIEKTQVSSKEADETRKLTDEEKQILRENTKLSDKAIDKIYVDADGRYHLPHWTDKLAGKIDESTGIKYVEKTININGVEITVVVPEFKSLFDCEISAELWGEGDDKIFKNCTEQLRDYLEAHPELKAKFNDQQLEQIKNGEARIKGYTWHHTEIPGKMQLVETKTHFDAKHIGGNQIWCGGIR